MRKGKNMEVFAVVPSEIIIDILSRLPVRSVINCKCVCKSWLELVETHEFAKSHLSNSVPGIAVSAFDSNIRPSNWCRTIELTDVPDIEVRHNYFQLNAIINLQFPSFPNPSKHILLIKGSADGLLLLHKVGYPSSLYLWNPVTREYIDLGSQELFNLYSGAIAYGIGKSTITGKYKVVMLPKSECIVYTIGTGSWRSIASHDALLNYEYSDNGGAFVNGNLHWLACDSKGSLWISCFDLETELFTTFSIPLPASHSGTSHKRLCALEGCLCLCFNTFKGETEIWLMNEYGVEKSWTKKFVIPKYGVWVGRHGGVPFKVFKDGDILLSCDTLINFLLYYCSKNKTVQRIQGPCYLNPALHISSFLSLKSFVMENTISY